MTDPLEIKSDEPDVTLAPGRFPLARVPVPRGLAMRIWKSSLARVALYYIVLLAVGFVLVQHSPVVRRAVLTPVVSAAYEGAALITGEVPAGSVNIPPPALSGTWNSAVTTALVIFGAILLSIPVAWVYMLSKRLRFDPGLVRTVIILPIAVAGILLVVKHSLAIAFSLAGIVAIIRFRNTLKDPRDAVYIFLTIAIGVAAGVQALDVALVVSFIFNVVVILLWKFQVGSIYGGRYLRSGVLSIGDSSLMVAQTPVALRKVRRGLVGRVTDMKTDGILLVHSTDPDLARQTVQDALSQTARDWQLMGIWPRGEVVSTAEYLVRLAKDTTPADLIGELDEWSAQIAAAEYIPFRLRDRPRSDTEPAKKDKDEDRDKNRDEAKGEGKGKNRDDEKDEGKGKNRDDEKDEGKGKNRDDDRDEGKGKNRDDEKEDGKGKHRNDEEDGGKGKNRADEKEKHRGDDKDK